MNKVNWNRVSNWLFYLGVLVGALGYYRIYKIKASLPPGVCPVNDNRGLLYLGIIILLSSVVTAYINDWQIKRLKKTQNDIKD